VLPLQGANFVWVVDEGKAARRQVELGVRTPGFVEIKSGVQRNQQVVVGGQERLAEGAPVQIKLVDRRPAGGQEESAAAVPRGNGVEASRTGAPDGGTDSSAASQP
jgi:hypothetical protein